MNSWYNHYSKNYKHEDTSRIKNAHKVLYNFWNWTGILENVASLLTNIDYDHMEAKYCYKLHIYRWDNTVYFCFKFKPGIVFFSSSLTIHINQTKWAWGIVHEFWYVKEIRSSNHQIDFIRFSWALLIYFDSNSQRYKQILFVLLQ